MSRELGLPLLALLAACPAWAFKPAGHDIIEATAYKRLINGREVYRLATGEGVSGREIVQGLIENHALLPPACFDISSDDEARRCEVRQARYSGTGWPALTTGLLDELFDRQFDSVGQCFHFMARGSDVWDDAHPDSATGVPPGLAKDAYLRCEGLLEALMSRILRDPYTRSDRLYALMHAVTDSFSAAHTERIGPRVSYLKPWDLLTWVPYQWHRNALPYLHTLKQHAVVDARDDDFLVKGGSVEGRACDSFAHPYEVPEGCLTGRALDAVSALVDLLVVTDGLLALQREPGSSIDAPAASAWTDYVRSHLDSEAFKPPSRLDPNVGEWRPQRSVGVRFERDFNLTIPSNVPPGTQPAVEATSIAAVVQLIHAEPAILPFNLTSDFELGGSHLTVPGAGTADAIHAGIELPAVLPVADYVAIGITPLRVVGDFGPKGSGWGLWDLDYRLGARAEVILKPGIWIGLSYPFFSWTTTQFHPWDFSIVAGYSIKEPRSSASGGSLPLLDGRRWSPGEKTDGSVPPPRGLLGISFTNVTEQNLFVVTGRFTSDYDAWMDRRGFGWGLELGTFLNELPDRTFKGGGVSAGAAVRYYLLSNLLALELRPLTAQWTTHAPGGPQHWVVFDDLGGDAGVVVPLSLLEVHVYSPRWSYTPGAPAAFTPRGLQIGLTFNFARVP